MELHARGRRQLYAMARCRVLVALLIMLSTGLFLVFLARVPTGALAGAFPGLQLGLGAAARAGLFVPPRRLPLAVQGMIKPTATSAVKRGVVDADGDDDQQAVLLPDWEVLVLLRRPAGNNATCEFGGGGGGESSSSSSPARALGRIPSSGRHAYVCVMPKPVRRRQPFRAPRVVLSGSSSSDVPVPAARGGDDGDREPEMLRWRGRLVYESAVVDGGDVLVFAKGVNPRQGVNRPADDVRCVYYRGADASDVVASIPAYTSAQQVFRCPPPPSTAVRSSQELRVTLAVTGEDHPIPSLAVYSSPAATMTPAAGKKKLICACTMVRDVAKFLREWVVYHAAVGMDRFYIYDNGSEDDLAGQVRQLSSAGYDISTVAWPWTKAQEAGFSHATAVHRDSCEWMAFIDVDEYVFSPHWLKSKEPAPQSMLRSLVSSVEPDVGQVMLGCADFSPSGQTAHPKEGVTQGYTCRRRTEERHKSLVRLEAVDQSLLNSIHHFALRPDFRGARSKLARVNHYKYQAWEEFKVKFRRRVSTYVADWTNPVNLKSKDRTPGLGFEAVEPEGWRNKFCEVDDTLLRDATQRWFGVGFSKQTDSTQEQIEAHIISGTKTNQD